MISILADSSYLRCRLLTVEIGIGSFDRNGLLLTVANKTETLTAVTLTMENKQGLFWPLKGFSPSSTSSPMSTLLRRRNKYHLPPPLGATCPSTPVRPLVEAMLLLGVLGAPLAPLHVCTTHPFPHLAIKDTPIETSSAQYILHQYIAASGGLKLQDSICNAYAMGKVRMIASEFETANKLVRTRNPSKAAESGGFVLWQMKPDMWYVELSLGGSKVHAGCNGKLVWRHTPWLGPHAAKGPPRPLRRALQGLDPRTTASMFINARCIGEKKINEEDCFILKICSDPSTLKARSEGSAEIIRHVLLGHFSQKTGLLIHLEDSHLTRIQNNGGDAVYWETTINSFLDDYRPVEGIMIAHSGRSQVTLFKFGETAMSHTKTRMEEAWIIEEVAFNVPGLSLDCFIPPAELRFASVTEACEFPLGLKMKSAVAVAEDHAKVPRGLRL
uniref:Uncharacterized protein LOC101510935 n=1 Tax=Cicer arietinum TaxID=3827 RepID=A0A1S2YA69_CICAR|nr:uncharacterized protein LOC101510935 [Cicer arietinum]